MVVLEKLTTPHLIDAMLPPLVDSLKEAVAVTIQSGKVSPLIPDVGARDSISTDARNVHVRIAGAARESRFGREDEFERPDFRSDDGALLLLLKQANAVFLDRTRLALDGSDLCQHPVLYPSTSRNAYLLTAHAAHRRASTKPSSTRSLAVKVFHFRLTHRPILTTCAT